MTEILSASEEAIQQHYDVGNSFYEAILGESMCYTAALWPDDEPKTSLSKAQISKLDWHLESADIRPGDRLLDIGCGWGSFMHHAVSYANAGEAIGLTLSREQHDWIARKFAGTNISSQVCRWEDFDRTQRFDCISAIGVMEHFAQPGLSTEIKTEAYRRFFEFCHGLLPSGRSLSIQTIVWMNVEPGAELSNLPLDFFPESDLPYMHEVIVGAAPFFNLMHVTNRPFDYSKTLREWVRNLRAHEDILIAEYGEATVRKYSREFTSFIMGFDRQKIGLARMSFSRK